jgi:[protein-PII] uridylyltransferase
MPSAHLEKVLRHAERKLVNDSHRKPTDLLDLYRKFLKLEEHRIKLGHAGGGGGREIVQKRADLLTVVLRHVWTGAWESGLRAHSGEPPRMVLAAVGGFGRSELNPYSDVDILFLYAKQGRERPAAVQDIVEQVLYMLWDVGFNVGHATRTLEEAFEQAEADFQTKTSLLESRFLAGDESLWQEFERSFGRLCIQGKENAYIRWRMNDQAERHRKFGNTVFLQEPNVKNSCGGLRDYQSMLWIAWVKRGIRNTQGLQEAQFITAAERKTLDQAYDFILRVRTELHYLQKRAGDILTLRLQGRVANNFRYQHKHILRRTEALMRDYYFHANQLFLISNSLAQRLAGEKKGGKRVKWSFLPFKATKAEHVDGFIIQANEIEPEEGSVFGEDPMRLLRVFQLAQQRGAAIGPELAFRIRRRLAMIDRRFIYQKPARELLLAITSRKGQVGRIFRNMHELGVLGRIFPEFAPLTCLVQHEFFHQYTADEHTLVCLEMLDRIIDATERPFAAYRPLMQNVTRPHVLYLAMLLHDTGKSKNRRHHADMSADNAVRVARRLKLSPDDLAILVFLVDHHLTMSETARRKNIDDDETIIEFARIVQTQERLDLLMLLTFADYQGTTGQGHGSDWKELLLWHLHHRTSQALIGQEEFVLAAQKSLKEIKSRIMEKLGKELEPVEIEAHFQNLPSRYFSQPEPLIINHLRLVHEFLWNQIMHDNTMLRPILSWIDHEEEGHSEVSLVTWDRDTVFSRVTGAFAAAGLSILSADIFTRTDNIVVKTFRVCNSHYGAVTDPRDKKAVQELLAKALDAEEDPMPKALGRAEGGQDEASFPTTITFDLQASTAYTLLDLQAPDRPGLLHLVAKCLAQDAIRVHFARITTEKGAALDTFYLCDREGHKITDESILAALRGRLQRSVEGEA